MYQIKSLKGTLKSDMNIKKKKSETWHIQTHDTVHQVIFTLGYIVQVDLVMLPCLFPDTPWGCFIKGLTLADLR